MSGHNKWSKIKHKKGASDQKKGQVFSKLSKIISIAARKGSDPNTNLELKNVIDQAKTVNMPNENIQRAIKRATDKEMAELQTIQIEAVGPQGSAFIIEGITDNTNRTIAEVKSILKSHEIKMVPLNSLVWMFRKDETGLVANIIIGLDENNKNKVENFLEELDDHEDIKIIYSNIE